MTRHVIEIATFNLKQGVSDEALFEAAGGATRFLKSQPGFISRHLSRGDNGDWLEHVEWRSLSEAKAASQRAEQEPTLTAFFAAADPQSVSFTYRDLVLCID